MQKLAGAALTAVLLNASSASAEPPALKPELQGLGFLLGDWSTPERGRVAETGGFSTGRISFTPAASGAVLLRQDHVQLFEANGKPAGGFDILMMIYPEAGGVHADYADGAHVIHYTSASVEPGRSVTFNTAPSPGAPRFRLSYRLSEPKRIAIAFSAAPPGSPDFHAIAEGAAVRDR